MRERFKVTVIGIRRGEVRITSPGGGERIEENDQLILVGGRDTIAHLRESPLWQQETPAGTE
jgi:K+/H+ antiporter YhaU regulatory subunit KhtT